jgi:PIN domain
MDLSELKELVQDGRIGAITLDTSVFDAQGLKLESGSLKQLEQFRDGLTRFIISDIIKEEVLSHLNRKARDVKTSVESSLKQAKYYWQIQDSEIEDIKQSIFSGREPEDITSEQFNRFIEKTSLEIVEAQNYLVVNDLIQRYFKAEPPFSENGKKKSEFPDAIALMSLEEWAEENETEIIVVSSDKDWEGFCEVSERLHYCKELTDALELFQLSDSTEICKYLSRQYLEGNIDELKEDIWDALRSEVWSVYPKATSSFVFESEITDITIEKKTLILFESPDIIFRAVNYDDSKLTISSRSTVDIDVECNFSFSVYDATVGGNILNAQTSLEIEILITLLGDFKVVGSEFELDEIEVLFRTPLCIDFGEVEPDWGTENNDCL